MADSKSGGHKRTETKSVADTAWAAAVAKRARFAATTPAGKGLCLQTYDGEIEMWALDTDQQKRKLQTRNAVGVRAVSTGCLVHTTTEGKSRAVLLPHEGAPKTLATHGTVTALGSSDDELFVAAGQQLFVFNLSGEETLRLLASVGITAVARLTTDWLAVGYANGNVELLRSQETSATTASATPNQSLERTPASGVTRIIPGPMGTLIAGYGNGFVGMWSMRDGKLLADGHIHGPIEHLLLEDHGLYAASSLGQHLVWDLSTFYVERCTLLREVWQRVPVVWQEGRAVAATPPANHPCAEPGAQQ